MRANIFTMVWSFLLVNSILLSAQTLTSERHTPYGRDSLLVYKMPYLAVPDTGRNCIWDFSALPLDSAVFLNVDYSFPLSEDTNQLCLHREHNNYYYHISEDTLWQTGYENSRASMHYTHPFPRLRFPFAYGDSLSGRFTGEGQYCHLIPLSIEGAISAYADASGLLILPDDTIDNALRVHTLMHYQEKKHPLHSVQEERYFWYGENCRYPLVESVTTHTIKKGDTVSFRSTYYYPQEQEGTPFEEQLQSENMTEADAADSLVTDVCYLPNPVYNDVQIKYSLARQAQVYISLHYNGGVTTYQSPVQSEEEGYHIVKINMSGMPIGSYVVYIHAGDTIVRGNIIKL